jgi:hypothetical protein
MKKYFLFLFFLFISTLSFSQTSLDSLRLVLPEVSQISSFGISKSNKFIWIALTDNSVSIIDRKYKKIVRTFNNPKQGEWVEVLFSNDDKYVILNYYWGGSLLVYSLISGELVYENKHGYKNCFSFFNSNNSIFGFSKSGWLDESQEIFFGNANSNFDSINICCGLPYFNDDYLFYLDSDRIRSYDFMRQKDDLFGKLNSSNKLLFASYQHKCAIVQSEVMNYLYYFKSDNEIKFVYEIPKDVQFHSKLNENQLSFSRLDDYGNIQLYVVDLNEQFILNHFGTLLAEKDYVPKDYDDLKFVPVNNNGYFGVYFLDHSENAEIFLEDKLRFKNFKTNRIETVISINQGFTGQGMARLSAKRNSIQLNTLSIDIHDGISISESDYVNHTPKEVKIWFDSLKIKNNTIKFYELYLCESTALNFLDRPAVKYSSDSIFFNFKYFQFSIPILWNFKIKNENFTFNLLRDNVRDVEIYYSQYAIVLTCKNKFGKRVSFYKCKAGITAWTRCFNSNPYFKVINANSEGIALIDMEDSLVFLDYFNNKVLKVFHIVDLKEYYQEKLVYPIMSSFDYLFFLISVSPGGPYIEFSSIYHADLSDRNYISKIDLNTPKNINSLFYSDSMNTLYYSTQGDLIGLYSLKTKRNLLYFQLFSDKNFLVKLPNSPYYMCSKDASKMLHYVTPSLKVIGFEQLDPVYNRPDIVLDSIGKYFGNSDGGMIDEYRKSWEKRIDRLGLDKEKLGKGEIAVPNAEIVAADDIAYENKAGKIEIKVSANDPKYSVRRFNVFVNEVPLYGSAGISIAHLKKQVWDTTVSVPLSVGENKIQVSVMNELGLENFKYPTYVNYTPEKEIVAKTHYIGIGVNEFKETEHNLKYCVKDVTDLAKSFGSANTEVKLFTDQQVTRENILALKEYLKKTSVNDKVIISCSSHGLLDDSLNFYLAMHDVNFNNPKTRGLKYEELESLLDGIPARQKLLLLDACNSGENDKTELLKKELAQAETQKETSELAEYKNKTKGVIIKLEEKNKSNFKKMNELFVNVRNNTGSVIISAAGGQESALEAIKVDGKTIENGAFTYSVLECLKQNEGKELKVNTLKQYAEKRVEEITNGKQKPTSRQETMEMDWGVR